MLGLCGTNLWSGPDKKEHLLIGVFGVEGVNGIGYEGMAWLRLMMSVSEIRTYNRRQVFLFHWDYEECVEKITYVLYV